jgi:FKBP-type peptidyl-prolyl cis-trans isomerase FkpA
MKRASLLFSALLLALVTAGCNAADPQSHPKEKTTMAMPKTVTDLMIIDLKTGGGADALPPDNVSVHYTGWLYDPNQPDGHGKKFDSSLDRGEPFTFLLGGGQVIRGWDQGVAGLKVGGKRTLIIPSHLGYGARGAGGVIPPYATLVFDVELLGIR